MMTRSEHPAPVLLLWLLLTLGLAPVPTRAQTSTPVPTRAQTPTQAQAQARSQTQTPTPTQPAAEPIDSFAERYTRLFVAAYDHRDIPAYTRLMTQWQDRCSQLPLPEKKRLAPYTINAWYNFSCTYALQHKPSLALDCLDSAIRSGYNNYGHLQTDPDLDSLRRNPRYIALVTPLRATGDYLYILRRAAAYNPKDGRPLPAFTYQPSDNPDLQTLRQTCRLDSIAGTGNDASRALNLLHWVHNGIPHDGNHENPVVKNALSLINECRQQSRGLNCRGLATVLNEAYLSLGYYARLVTCLPKDSLNTDFDCHVIVMVYIPSLQKWIWTDPTNDAYLMNEQGQLLGIEEVRTRIIRNQPLILNPDANWNHRSSTEKEQYLYHYMAKNLYILESPLNSQYDNETRRPGRTITYIQLLPLDYSKGGKDRSEFTDRNNGTTLVIYRTNDPGKFWQSPQLLTKAIQSPTKASQP